MIIRLNSVLLGENEEVSFDKEISLSDIDLQRFSVHSIEEAQVTGRVYRLAGNLYLDFKYTVDMIFECSRCLKHFKNSVQGSFTKELVQEKPNEEELDLVFYIQKDELDLKSLLLDSIYDHMSFDVLCDEDCKGLCPKCGQDLNVEECDCDLDEIDPRFAKLKGLIDQ